MQLYKFSLALLCLFIVACAKDASLLTDAPSPKHNHAAASTMDNSAAKKAMCAEPKGPPSVKCSETVTATFDQQGKLWIAWVHKQQIFVQSSSDKGHSFTTPVAVNAVPEDVAAQNESRPKIKLDAQGNIYITWVLTLDKKRSTYVRFSRSTDHGAHFSTPVTVNDNLEIIRHRFDTLAIGQHGEIFIAWLDARHTEAVKQTGGEFPGLSLYYTWSEDGGQHFHANQKIADHTCECCRLDSAINSANLPVIVWRHIFEDSVRDHALVNFTAWDKPGAIQHLGQEHWQIDACPHHGPALSLTDKDAYHAVWFSNSATHQGLFYAHANAAATAFSTPMNFAKQGASHPHVLAVGEHVGIVWQDYDGKHNRVLFMRSSDGGQSWSKPSVVAQSEVMLDEPFLLHNGAQFLLSSHAPGTEYQVIPLVD